jgi:integrase
VNPGLVWKRERKILSFEETARVLAHLEEPYRLIIETCIATGARISEVLGLQWKHVNLVCVQSAQAAPWTRADGRANRLRAIMLPPIS